MRTMFCLLRPLTVSKRPVINKDPSGSIASPLYSVLVAGEKAGVYADYRRILERKDIDAVLISSPDHWHAVQTVHACEAGKDVYCEKPACNTVAEGQAMVRATKSQTSVGAHAMIT